MTHEEKLEYLKNLDRETLSPSELSMLLGGRAYLYNVTAKDGTMTLPHIWRGRNLRIFKQPVLDLLSGNFNWTGKASQGDTAGIIPLYADADISKAS